MMKFILFFVFSVTSLFATSELTMDQKISDLDQLVSQIKSGYGPLDYKKKKFNIDIDELRKKYFIEIKRTKTNAEFYYLLLKLVAEFKDSHFRASLPSNYETTLGFTTDLIQNKIVIDEVDRKILSKDEFPFEKGDELISIDGIKVNRILQDLTSYMGHGNELTVRRRAAFQIGKRRIAKVPGKKGTSIVEVKKSLGSKIEQISLEWKGVGSFTDEMDFKFLNRSLRTVNYDLINIDENDRCQGTSRIKIPEDAKILVSDPFLAYTYNSKKGLLGYVRLPHYSPETFTKYKSPKEELFKKYESVVKDFEQKTIGLIIDQTHNCGGSVDWMQRILSLFMTKPFKPLQFELLATKASLVDFEEWASDMDKKSSDYKEYNNVLALIKDSWLTSSSRLTPKTSISGERVRSPNPIHYTKPIIVLIDELSASGGDAFPALIQGNKRAKLLGTQTMGAGGHVADEAPLNYSRIKISITKSLFYRPDGVAVENNGAVPDIFYEVTLDDFKNGYKQFQNFYTQELLKIIP